MELFKKIFGKKPKKKKVTVEHINKLLFNSFEDNLFDSINTYKDFLYDDEVIPEENFYLVFGAVEILILGRVFNSYDLKDNNSKKEFDKLMNLYTNSITYGFADRYKVKIKEEEKIFNKIIEIKNKLHKSLIENKNNKPSPNWYQAKTLIKLLYNPDLPNKVDEKKYKNPVYITFFTEIVHARLINKKKLFDDLFDKFIIVTEK